MCVATSARAVFKSQKTAGLLPSFISFLCFFFAFSASLRSFSFAQSTHPVANRYSTLAIPDGGRFVIDAPDYISGKVPIRLIFFALPNGNSIEWSAGATTRPGDDWHYNIQHIAAQTALLRVTDKTHDYIVAYLESPKKSWPAWSADHKDDAPPRAREIVGSVEKIFALPGRSIELSLVCHSGGGSFVTRYLIADEPLPSELKRIAYIDGYYGYDDEHMVAEKLLGWLNDDTSHQFVLSCYDDRNIVLNGKKVVSDTGGSYRAAYRLLANFDAKSKPTTAPFRDGSVTSLEAAKDQAHFIIHANPDNLILHTRLVEWNGFLRAMTIGDSNLPQSWVPMTETHAYDAFIPAHPLQFPTTRSATTRLVDAVPRQLDLPPRDSNALGGHAWISTLTELSSQQQQDAIRNAILSGNAPMSLRTWKTIHVESVGGDGRNHVAEFRVLPDYLAVGSATDFVRMPMLPATAQQIADALHCTLPTRKMVDDIYEAAEIKLDPQPMTDRREALQTFIDQNDLIQFDLDALNHGMDKASATTRPAAALIAGTKKDIVITPRLATNPHKVAIYGWHTRDGRPIQPLTTVHTDTYADYSHGVRLIASNMTADGQPTTVQAVLADPSLCVLLSDEGPMTNPRY